MNQSAQYHNLDIASMDVIDQTGALWSIIAIQDTQFWRKMVISLAVITKPAETLTQGYSDETIIFLITCSDYLYL